MEATLTIKNYRCFPQTHPLKVQLLPGFTSFVGTNNSGKSTVLKFFYEFRSLFVQLGTLFSDKKTNVQTQFEPPVDVLDPAELFFNRNDASIQLDVQLPRTHTNPSPAVMDSITCTIARPAGTQPEMRKLTYECSFQLEGETLTPAVVSRDHKNSSKAAAVKTFTDIVERAMYIGPFRNAIDHKTNQPYFDLSCGKDFIATWRKLKTGKSKADKELIFRTTKTIQTVLGFEEFDIDSADDNDALHVSADGKSYRLGELGAGLAHVIIVLTNCAIRKPSLVLIDEPELNLHPSMQVKFLQALGALAKQGVLFSTHSYGLARSASDHRFVVRKDSSEPGVSVVQEMERCRSLGATLGELTYSGYLEMGGGDILLVEGSTSVKVLMELLRLYDKTMRVVVVPLGGSDMIRGGVEIELQEVKRLAGEHRVIAVVDSERPAEGAPAKKEVTEFEDVCRKTGLECVVLRRTAIENYFPDKAVKKALGDGHTALAEFQRLNDVANHWHKSENWRIARVLTKNDLKGTDLGEFLETL